MIASSALITSQKDERSAYSQGCLSNAHAGTHLRGNEYTEVEYFSDGYRPYLHRCGEHARIFCVPSRRGLCGISDFRIDSRAVP